MSKTVWTQFWDMSSGGGMKEKPYRFIYIEAESEEQAKVIFYNRFGHNPERVTCTCCGEDYSISSNESLEQLTGYHRNCHYDEKLKQYTEVARHGKYSFGEALVSPAEYEQRPDVLIVRASEIKPEERIGDIPQQGYVWV